MRNRSRLAALFFALAVVLSSLLIPSPALAYTKCADYGGCTICDFFSPEGQYQGYIEWCNQVP
jgi:hypothetical protein